VIWYIGLQRIVIKWPVDYNKESQGYLFSHLAEVWVLQTLYDSDGEVIGDGDGDGDGEVVVNGS